MNIGEIGSEKLPKIVHRKVICPCGEDLGLYSDKLIYFCNKCGKKQTNKSLKMTFYRITTLPFEISIEDVF